MSVVRSSVGVMITLTCTVIDGSGPDVDFGRVSAAEWAQFDAVFDPEELGSFAGTVADVLAREDSHARGDAGGGSGGHDADCGGTDCDASGQGDACDDASCHGHGCDESGCDDPGCEDACGGGGVRPGSVAGWLSGLASRPVDAQTRAAVAVVDPVGLSGIAARDYLAVTDKVLAADTAAQHAAVCALVDTVAGELTSHLSGREARVAATGWTGEDSDRWVREEVERVLVISPSDAATRVETARDLRDRLPVTAAWLAAGMVSARKAAQLSGLLATSSDEVAARVDAELAGRAQGLRPASLRRRVARRIAALDPDHARAREAAVVTGRRVRRWTDPDGAATLALTGPPEQVERAWIAITGTALAQLRDCPQGCRPGCPHAGTAAVIRDADHLYARAAATVRPEADTTDTTARDGHSDGHSDGHGQGVRPGADSTDAAGAGEDGRGVRPGADTTTAARSGGASEARTRASTAGVRPGTDSTGPTTDAAGGQDAASTHARARGWLDRARFDAAVGLLSSVFDAPWYLTGPGRRRTLVQLVTTVDTLTGADEDLSELVGHGPVTAATARRIAADADLFQHLQVHPDSGFLLDAGTVRHDPPARLREFLLARRPVCSIPGCTRPATAGDLDHGIEHRPDGHGGPTAAWSIGPLCRYHHRARTLHLWRPSNQRLDGSLTWTDHTGRTYHQPAHDLRPDPHHDTPPTS